MRGETGDASSSSALQDKPHPHLRCRLGRVGGYPALRKPAFVPAFSPMIFPSQHKMRRRWASPLDRRSSLKAGHEDARADRTFIVLSSETVVSSSGRELSVLTKFAVFRSRNYNKKLICGFVADSILRGFDLNNAAPETSSAPESSAAGKFVPGPQSAATGSATSVAQEYEEEILSQPMVPYVGMTFDDIEEAREVYNNYAYKLGFGTHIGNTKYSTAQHAPKGTILSRVFECVHAGKPSDGTTKTTRSKSEGSVAMDMSSFSA
ncbi:hypothetical protein ACQ4PT_071138 [Festuca glaucescens]